MQNQRTKMCPNCEGNVALEVSMCPYCGGSVFEQNENLSSQKSADDVKTLSYEETLASLYPPPYKPKVIETNSSMENEENYVEEPKPIQKGYEQEEVHEEEVEEEVEQNALIPTVLFWFGVNAFIFSILLLVFSKDGVLYLKWNSSYWFLYSLIALPFLFFGFKGLKNLD